MFLLTGALALARRKIEALKEKLTASEQARQNIEAKLDDIEALRAHLDAAEEARDDAASIVAIMKKKLKRVDDREAVLTSRLEAMSSNFASEFTAVVFLFLYCRVGKHLSLTPLIPFR